MARIVSSRSHVASSTPRCYHNTFTNRTVLPRRSLVCWTEVGQRPSTGSDLVGVEYTKEQQLYRILVPSGHILLTFCVRIGTFDRSRVSGLVQVFRVSCIIVTSVRVQRANMDH